MTPTPYRLMTELLDYVVEQGREIDPRAYDLATRPDFKCLPHELAGLPGVEFDLQTEGDHVWLRVERLQPVPAPLLPAEGCARRFIAVAADDPAGPVPHADETALARAHEADAARLDPARADAADTHRREAVASTLRRFVPLWLQWAEAERPRRRAVALYGGLFDLKGRLEAEETAKPSELVWGLGVAAWKLPLPAGDSPPAPASRGGAATGRDAAAAPAGRAAPAGTTVDFRYPLLTQRMEIEIDRRTHSISVRPRAVEPRLEFDAFGACQVRGSAEVEQAARRLLDEGEGERQDENAEAGPPRERQPQGRLGEGQEPKAPKAPEPPESRPPAAREPAARPLSPFDRDGFEPVLKLVAGALDDRGRYDERDDALPVPGPHLVVTRTGVLFARPRSNSFVVADIGRLKDRLRSGDELPDGPLCLVTAPADEALPFEPVAFRGLSSDPRQAAAAAAVHELHFPLPYNREQETIVAQLERSPGVVVQGPPGTGKTHTIANIICHYLATGRKVLVTSRGEQALEVLQSKIPEQVRPLTVALLAGDREGLRQFQTSIETIVHELTQLDPAAVEREIAACRSAIGQAHAELARIDRRVDDIARTQFEPVEVDGVPLRAQQMAELVVEGDAEHGWLDDALTLAPEHAPPLAESEAATLRETRRRLGADLAHLGARLPASTALPSEAELGRLHELFAAQRRIDAALAVGELPALRSATPRVLGEARRLLGLLDEALALGAELEQQAAGADWPSELRARCRRADFAAERQALEALFDDIDALVEARADFLKRPVELPARALGLPKAREAIARAAGTGRPFGLLSFGAGEAQALLAEARVAGLPLAGADDWRHVQRYAELHERVRSFGARWNAFAGALALPQVEGGVEALREIERIALAARKAHRLATFHDAQLPALARRVFAEAPPERLFHGGAEGLARVREDVSRHLERAELAASASQAAAFRQTIEAASGPLAQALRRFAAGELGDPALGADRVLMRYAGLVGELRRIEGLAADLDLVAGLTARIEAAGAPRWAARLRTEPAPASGDDPVLPARWRTAWNRARLKSHLDAVEARQELVALAARRGEAERRLAGLYETLVSKSAWLATRRNATPRVLAALETYRTAVRKIGHGTGPNATRHRRDAQRAMTEAQAAVPCWVMSHARVSETLPAAFGSFDLVIVDEASQSNLWALPAVLRGRQLLVVGDDKQVSPEGSFISAAKIRELKERFLATQPYATVLTPEKSLYDLASTVYAAHKVMLREHFRCVPPIIAYSNRTFYDGFIQPLRIPRPSERIDPPLVDLFVPDGVRDARDVNAAEAEAIAAEIEAVLADPRYSGRSLGVVSLLGAEQARAIDTLVRSRCDAGELMRRRFECGDARVFQGSERDIMFLSLVADRVDHKALSGNLFEQRFNVAASRARDRMVLVRSVRREELSPADLRVGLLEHFSRPLDGGADAQAEAEVAGARLIDRCESGFERQVYAALAGRGFRVVPQVRAGAFRIDLVVEGANDARLAIECDGDDFHGPERWQADIARQRMLERAGWTFWRCFASTWTLRRDEVLAELLGRLRDLGIEPLGALERTPALVEYREWRPPPAPDGEAPGKAAEEALSDRDGNSD